MAWTAAMTNRTYEAFQKSNGAMERPIASFAAPTAARSDEMLKAAAALTLELPGVDWVIEVDLLGRHRITIHFKGASIDLE